jgi:FixJ family two-component response regulator
VLSAAPGDVLNNRNKKLVAVVDDDAIMLKSIISLLDAHGFSPRGFVSAEAFLEGDGVTEAACLVLDVHLDGMSGIDLGRQLAVSGCALPVIFITASEDEDTEREATANGCIAYLRKPFSGGMLIDAIEKAMR